MGAEKGVRSTVSDENVTNICFVHACRNLLFHGTNFNYLIIAEKLHDFREFYINKTKSLLYPLIFFRSNAKRKIEWAF